MSHQSIRPNLTPDSETDPNEFKKIQTIETINQTYDPYSYNNYRDRSPHRNGQNGFIEAEQRQNPLPTQNSNATNGWVPVITSSQDTNESERGI